MTPCQSKAAFLIALTLCACSSKDMSENELREFNALERALDTLSTAPPEDREIRLKAAPAEQRRQEPAFHRQAPNLSYDATR